MTNNSSRDNDDHALVVVGNSGRNGDNDEIWQERSSTDHETIEKSVGDNGLSHGMRYAGYSATFARLFRYFAFASDFGEALRPVISARIVTASYAIALGYCTVDVAYESYKETHRRDRRPISRVIVERASFHALASLVIPAVTIHSVVRITKAITQRMNKFNRWGPSIAGLCCIPLLPVYVDHPIDQLVEKTFQRYGPWAEK